MVCLVSKQTCAVSNDVAGSLGNKRLWNPGNRFYACVKLCKELITPLGSKCATADISCLPRPDVPDEYKRHDTSLMRHICGMNAGRLGNKAPSTLGNKYDQSQCYSEKKKEISIGQHGTSGPEL